MAPFHRGSLPAIPVPRLRRDCAGLSPRAGALEGTSSAGRIEPSGHGDRAPTQGRRGHSSSGPHRRRRPPRGRPGLRLAGFGKDLWLDEIWSIQVAHQMRSVFDALTLHHEINHYLNTVWLYLVGVDGTPSQYHAVALVSGVAGVAVAASSGSVAAFDRARHHGSVRILVSAVLYSSEARGYSTLVLAALLSFYFSRST